MAGKKRGGGARTESFLGRKVSNRLAYTIISLVALILVAFLVYAQTAPNPGHSASSIGPGTFGAGDYVFPSTSKVGIGTTSPTSKLDVVGGTVGGITAGIRINNTAGGGRAFQLLPGINGVSETGFEIYDVSSSAHRLVIDGNGNVGIGTTDIGTNKLKVAGNVDAQGFTINGAPLSTGGGVSQWVSIPEGITYTSGGVFIGNKSLPISTTTYYYTEEYLRGESPGPSPTPCRATDTLNSFDCSIYTVDASSPSIAHDNYKSEEVCKDIRDEPPCTVTVGYIYSYVKYTRQSTTTTTYTPQINRNLSVVGDILLLGNLRIQSPLVDNFGVVSKDKYLPVTIEGISYLIPLYIPLETRCANEGGQAVTTGSTGRKICRFNLGYCPSGWTQYESWSTTTATTCRGASDCTGTSYTGSSCSTGGHAWSNANLESCDYYSAIMIFPPYCVPEYYTCHAQKTQVGCY